MFISSLFRFVALARYSEHDFGLFCLNFLFDVGHLYSSTLASYKFIFFFCILLTSVFVTSTQVAFVYMYSGLTDVLYRYIKILDFVLYALRCLSMHVDLLLHFSDYFVDIICPFLFIIEVKSENFYIFAYVKVFLP